MPERQMAVRLTYTSGGIDSATHAEFERCLRDARAAEPGKGGLGPYYLPQFMREQSRTVVS
jgi:hypothetical protein